MCRIKSTKRKKRIQEVVFNRDGFRCFWCARTVTKYLIDTSLGLGLPLDAATLDHVVPVADGGSNRLENLVTACRACNERRGATSAAVFMAESVEALA